MNGKRWNGGMKEGMKEKNRMIERRTEERK